MTGTGMLLRVVVRRERITFPTWVLVIVLLTAGMISYIHRYFPTPQALRLYAEVIRDNPVFLGLGGPVTDPSIGAMAAWRGGGLPYLLAAWMAVSIVIRHTRAEEESGRHELLLAGVVGRHAPSAAALLAAAGASLLAGLLAAGALVASGVEPTGSIAYGAAIAAAGWVFAAVAALAAQLAESARTATRIGITVLGVSYLVRYLGDATGQSWLVWLSPLGWSHLVRAYGDERWWLLAVSAAAATVLLAAAYRMAARRDLGAGLLPVRQGPATAPALRGPFSLAWRLQRGLLAAWATGLAAIAAVFAGLSGVAPRLADQPGSVLDGFIQRYGGPSGDPVDAYLWIIVLLLGYTCALYPVLATLRLHAEETSGRADAFLSTAVGRIRWAAGHLVIAMLGTLGLLAVGGTVTGLVYSLIIGDSARDLPRVIVAALGHVPAAWLVGAVATFAVGVLPRAAVAISWAAWGLVCVIGDLLGPLIGLWGWSRFEPFHYTPNIIADAPPAAAPPVVILVLTALLTGAALLRLRRRDLF
ncbi:ABC transporter permease [Streptosporangium sp. NBC_01756]|uniref:ABC transporter permease n=1 Tax=Streptosporangium sp. NBC_01756 TaxID=2975950 RepID=UPI002DD99E7B|nr:polyketide antibiotic transporter [Streptosporangium sp. NBC_01756]WSC89003.1 polyketide antibiotic transporter [Streptosporangium sp. NBC_01756]